MLEKGSTAPSSEQAAVTKVSFSQANVLLPNEPTSNLDLYSQIALEKAIVEYKGAQI